MVPRVFTRSCRRARPAGASRTPCRALAFHDIGEEYLILFHANIHRSPDHTAHAASSGTDTALTMITLKLKLTIRTVNITSQQIDEQKCEQRPAAPPSNQPLTG